MIKRRIGPNPHKDGTTTSGEAGCPDIFELNDGRFAIIGIDKTELILGFLPDDTNCGPDEKIVVIDRHVLIKAKDNIPIK